MNSNFLKKTYNKIPSGIKNLFSPFIRNTLIKSDAFIMQYNLLKKLDSMKPEEEEKLQYIELEKICIYAYENCKYYRKVFDENGFNPYEFSISEFKSKVPYMDKYTVLKNYDSINSDNIDDYYEAVTGGSTGKRMVVNTTRECLNREYAFVYHHYEKFNEPYNYKKSKMAYFGGDGSALITTNPLYSLRVYNSMMINNETIGIVVSDLNKHKPEYFRGLTSMVYYFCKLLKDNNLTLAYKIKGVVLQSENVYPFQNKLIKETLGCDTLTHYGHTERLVFAEQINSGSDEEGPIYKFNPLYGYTEIANDSEIVATGFINKKMPMIRYRTGDFAELVRNEGYKITGHRTASMVGKNGELVSLASFSDSSEVFERIIKYQFVQNELGKVEMNIVPGNTFQKGDIDEVHAFLKEKSKDSVEFCINLVKDIHVTPSGKYKVLIQNLPGYENRGVR